LRPAWLHTGILSQKQKQNSKNEQNSELSQRIPAVQQVHHNKNGEKVNKNKKLNLSPSNRG
jgi:hypothetical protein